MEFVVPAARADDFFPVDVTFSAAKTLCQVRHARPAHGNYEQLKLGSSASATLQRVRDNCGANAAVHELTSVAELRCHVCAGGCQRSDACADRAANEVCVQLDAVNRWLRCVMTQQPGAGSACSKPAGSQII